MAGLQLFSAAVRLDAAWSKAGLDSRSRCDEFRSIPRNDARRPRWAARDVTQRRLGEKLGAMKRREPQPGKKYKYQQSATTAAPRTRCSKIVE